MSLRQEVQRTAVFLLAKGKTLDGIGRTVDPSRRLPFDANEVADLLLDVAIRRLILTGQAAQPPWSKIIFSRPGQDPLDVHRSGPVVVTLLAMDDSFGALAEAFVQVCASHGMMLGHPF
ncbi:hypothetical protein [Microcystis phage MACPNOA1]|nr:hypothetical protein [Microcystis phage MACPNOA1]